VPHSFGATPVAFFIIAATALQSARRCGSTTAFRNEVTLSPVGWVFGLLLIVAVYGGHGGP